MTIFAATIVIIPLTNDLERATRVVEFVAPNANMARAIAAKKADEITADYAAWGWIYERGCCCPTVEAYVDHLEEVE